MSGPLWLPHSDRQLKRVLTSASSQDGGTGTEFTYCLKQLGGKKIKYMKQWFSSLWTSDSEG